MITVRMNPYSKHEVRILTELFSQMGSALGIRYCKECCEECNIKHVCYDVFSALQHLKQKSIEQKGSE